VIDGRLRQTQRQVKGVDLAVGLITLAVATLVYLFGATIIDHWIVSGGLGFWGRLAIFAGLAAMAGGYFVRRIAPLLIRRINPLFAAYTLEQSRPSLKNGLINLLFLRPLHNQQRQSVLAQRVYDGLQRTTVAELAQTPMDTAVDRSRIIRWGYALVAVLLICSIYLVASPKNPLPSFGRMLWPWASMAVPTRVTIEDVRPGDTSEYQGEMVTVSAVINGVREGEPVLLYFSTADGQTVDEAVPMAPADGHRRHQGQLPPGKLGLRQNIEYYLAAGDCKAGPFSIDVQTALTIQVDSVRYDYPAYTGLESRVERNADLRAVEGTRVTIQATANRPIDWAAIEMDGDPRQRLKMTAEGSRATGGFNLAMDPRDRARSEHSSYQLRFAETSADLERENRQPVRHRIEVIPDLAPEIEFVDPPAEEIELPLGGILDLKVRAEDRDFGLRRVELRAECEGRSLPIPPLMNQPRVEPAHQGPFAADYSFRPARLGLKPRDTVVYWAEAHDNKEPLANRSETVRRRITITADGDSQSPADRPDGAQQEETRQPGDSPNEPGKSDMPADQPQQPDDSQQGDSKQGDSKQGDSKQGDSKQSDSQQGDSRQGDAGQEGQPGQGAQQPPADGAQSAGDGAAKSGESAGESNSGKSGKPGEPGRRSRPIDGDSNPGDVFEEVLKQQAKEREQEQAENRPDGQAGANDRPAEPNAAEDSASQPASGQSPPEKPTAQQAGDARPDSERPDSEQPDSEQPDSGQPSSEPPASGEPTAEEPSAEGRPQPGEGMPDSPSPSDDKGTSSTERPSQEGEPESGQEGGPADSKAMEAAGGPGNRPEKSQGSPEPQGANQPTERDPGDPREGDPGATDPAQSPSTSPKQSDAQSDQQGDRSGGGGEGGGQDSDQPGMGNPGSNTSADEGADPSQEQGEGETSSQRGNQVQADRPTGQPGQEDKGPGSSEKPSDSPPGDPSKQQQTQSQQPSSGPQDGSNQTGEGTSDPGAPMSGDPTRSGKPAGGGQASGNADDTPPEPGLSEGSTPNREYAEKATDLALEYLEDQLARQEPNQELLDRLGWTREDLAQFVRKWERMKSAAQREDDSGRSGRRELDEALKSLGLRPPGSQLQGGQTGTDQVRKTDSRRFDPPAKWKARFRQYTKGISQGKAGEEK
jgi:hypothetical protein